jgi:cellulose synthase/poly-beta-1,6-N-acetylglucosamine synthase-like glycosyltransferase
MISGLVFWGAVLGVFYVYLGYPLLVALLARLRPALPARPPVPGWPPFTPPVTLLIAAYNEEEVIAEKLENALALDYLLENLQILVAADGSTDRTPDIVRQFPQQSRRPFRGVELSYAPERRGKMAAINRAIPMARHAILVFSDANNLYESDTLRELVQPFSDPTVGMVSGSKNILKGDGVLGEAEGLYWRYESFIKQQETRLGTCTGVSGEVLALRRSLYQPCPEHIINDDFFLALNVIRQGYRVIYTPQARSYERVSASAQDEVVRRARIVAGRYQAMRVALRWLPWRQPLVVWQIVSHKFLRPLVPFGMLAALLANLAAVIWPPMGGWPTGVKNLPLIWLAFPYNWLLLFTQLGFYTLAWLGNRQDRRMPQSSLGKLLYLPAFLVNSNLAAILGLARSLVGKQTVLWQRVARRSTGELK